MSQGQSITPPEPADQFYRSLCQNAAVALVVTDGAHQIVCWNAAASELLGPSAQEMIGRPLEQAVPPKRRKLLKRLLKRTTERRQTSEFEISMEGADRQPRDLLVVLSHIPDRQGLSCGVAAWVIDQTNRKRLGVELAQAQKMASLGTLAGGVAHHFNNILGGVATFVDYALMSQDPADMRRALEMTAQAAARAAKITQSLLSFAQQGSVQADLADLTEVVLTFVHLAERPLAQKKIQLQLNLQPTPVVAVDANRMHQALGNLLTNAEEAMSDGGTVSIDLRRQDDQIVLTFSDTGPGISPEHLPLVFEPFFTTKGLLSGGDRANPGLGLSVVRGIIQELNGEISAQSEPGRGASFVIRLPIAQHDDEDQ